jgi:predicted aspartyl protease
VRINGKGPYSLVVDTGAAGTVLTKALIEELGLVADPNMRAVVRGTSGETSMQLYNLDSIALGGFEKRSVRATKTQPAGVVIEMWEAA